MRKLALLLSFFILFGCEEKINDHPVFKFYPSDDVFEEGFVSKYYYHYYPDNPDSRAGTEIGYTKYTKLNDTLFKRESYDAAFRLIGRRSYKVTGDSVLLHEGITIRNVIDTSSLNILNPTIATWDSDLQEPHLIQNSFNDVNYIYSEYQTAVIDTMMEGRRLRSSAMNGHIRSPTRIQ